MTHNFEFDQIAELKDRSEGRKACSKGICAVLAANWIRMMRDSKGSGAAARKNELLKIAKGGGGVTQKAFVQGWDYASDTKKNNVFLARAADSSIEEFKEGKRLVPGAEIASYVAANRQAGVHFSFGFLASDDEGEEEERGHSVAFWRSGQDTWHASGHVYFFDPNFGEYKGNKREVAAWFTNFMKTKYGNDFTWWYQMLLGPVSATAAPVNGWKVM
jgi:hypothetical protein